MSKHFMEKVNTCRKHFEENAYQDGLKCCMEMLDYYEKNELTEEIPDVFSDLMGIFKNFINANEVMTILYRMLDIVSKKHEPAEQIQVMRNIAMALTDYGEKAKAKEILENALEIAVSSKCRNGEVEILNATGTLAFYEDDYERACHFYEEAYRVAKEVKYDIYHRLIHNLALIYCMLDRLDESLEYFDLALIEVKKKGNEAYIGNTLSDMAGLYNKLGRHEEALDNYLASHEIGHKLENQGLLLESSKGLYETYRYLKDFENAMLFMEEHNYIEKKINAEKFRMEIAKIQALRDYSEIEKENNLIKLKNTELEALSSELKAANKYLEKTLEESLNMQIEIKKKNEELQTSFEVLKNIQAKLIRTEKKLAFGRMITSIAHEVNTPLGVLMTSISFIIKEAEMIDDRLVNGTLTKMNLKQFLTNIRNSEKLVKSSLKKMSEFITSLKISLAGKEGTKETEIKVVDFIKKVVSANTKLSAHDDYDIKIRFNDRNVRIWTLPGVIQNVIENILDNCYDHAFGDQENKEIIIRVTKLESELEIAIQDNGVGIDEKLLEIIFDPYTSKNMVERQGYGQGLYIARSLVEELLGGRMVCDSIVGKGTIMKLILPNLNN